MSQLHSPGFDIDIDIGSIAVRHDVDRDLHRSACNNALSASILPTEDALIDDHVLIGYEHPVQNLEVMRACTYKF